MGIWNNLFGKNKVPDMNGYFHLLNGYSPVFSNWNGCVYESELCRTAIDAIARHASKLQITLQGEAKRKLQTQLSKAPNSFQTWSQFLYRMATILYTNNTAFIVPVFDDYRQVAGVFPIAPSSWELVQSTDKKAWIRFKFDSGKNTAFMLSEVGICTRYQYKNDLFGENNSALKDTMDLIKIQRQGIEESTINAANYRFMAKVSNFAKTEDLAKERNRFNQSSFGAGGGGMLLFPNTYSDIRQVSQQTYAVDANQMALIQDNVYNYFGVNKDIIQNKAVGDSFTAFYEGCLEAIAVQLSEVMTRMIFTDREIGVGNRVFFTANRIQYMTASDKLNIATQLLDRGLITLNEAREIWNLPPVEGGDIRPIRGEYYDADSKLNGDETDGNE